MLKYSFSISLFFLFISLISEINSVMFNIKVKRGFEECIGEYLTEDTVAIFSMSTNLKNIIITLKDPKGKN